MGEGRAKRLVLGLGQEDGEACVAREMGLRSWR